MRRIAIVLAISASLVAGLAVASYAASPGAIFPCQFTGQTGNVDPVVAPGMVSAHPHVFFGARPVETIETSADLRTKPTTCVETGNHSAYWMPEVRENGVVLRPGTTATGGGKHLLVYYRCRHSASVCAAMQSFPENFAQVEGNANATSAAQNPAFDGGLGGFRCGTGGGVFSAAPPTTCSSGVLVVSFTFGNCLVNGALTDAINTACTSSGGRPVVRIQQYFRFWVGTGAVGTITVGGHPSYTAHADVFFGWDQATFEHFLNLCIRANRDCGTNPAV